MLGQIEVFLRRWLPNFEDDQRSYLTVAIGCTGGQHRSAFIAETLAQRFAATCATLARHRRAGRIRRRMPTPAPRACGVERSPSARG